MHRVRQLRRKGQVTKLIRHRLAAVGLESGAIEAKVALIQELIPLGLLHVEEELQRKIKGYHDLPRLRSAMQEEMRSKIKAVA